MAQPKRDPNDTRYWPRSDPLATGTGFSRRPKGLCVTNPSIDQSERTLPARPSGNTPEAVRRASRELYALLLQRIRERVESPDTFTLSELSQAAAVAARAGLGGEERDATVVVQIVRDGQLPTPPTGGSEQGSELGAGEPARPALPPPREGEGDDLTVG